jgi:hypothetical protein
MDASSNELLILEIFAFLLEAERTLHYTVVGQESTVVNQRQGDGALARRLLGKVPERKGPEDLARIWQSLCLPARLQYSNGYLHRRICVGRAVSRPARRH